MRKSGRVVGRSISGLVVAAALIALPAAPAAGQDSPAVASSGWAEVGLGYGWGQVTCDICRSDRRSGVEARFGVGRMLRPGFGLGAEVSVWISESDPVRQAIGSVHLVGRARPGGGPVFLHAGLGTGHHRALEPGSGDDVRMLAFSGRIGIGAETPLGDRYLLQPHIATTFGAFGTMRRGDREVWNRAGFNLIRAGIGVSRRGGR